MKIALSWSLLIGSTGGEVVAMWAWWKDWISQKQMVGVTLLLSFLALQFSAITTLFVAGG